MTVVREPRSAGGVLVRGHPDQLEVLLVRQKDGWRVPKGMMEIPESTAETAIREVREETGILPVIVRALHSSTWTYSYEGVDCHETCTWHLMVDAGQARTAPDSETLGCAWMSPGEATRHAAFDSDKSAVLAAVEAWLEIGAGVDHLPLADGIATGSLHGAGPLVLSREECLRLAAKGQRPVMLLSTFSPSDAALIGLCAGVGTVREGPTSHVAVVAAALEVACITAISGLIIDREVIVSGRDLIVPQGSLVSVSEVAGRLDLLLERVELVSGPGRSESVSDPEAARLSATRWAERVALVRKLPSPTNWKLFKRDLLGCYFPIPSGHRVIAPWTVDQVLDLVDRLEGRGVVRCSIFPRQIACHSISFTWDRAESEGFAARLAASEPTADLAVFVQEDVESLCWRLVRNKGRSSIEAGIGQAMYIFEEERGLHPTCRASWVSPGVLNFDDCGAPAHAFLLEFLAKFGSDLMSRVDRLETDLELDVFSVEGYFRIDRSSYVACDIDLPQDWSFMTAQIR